MRWEPRPSSWPALECLGYQPIFFLWQQFVSGDHSRGETIEWDIYYHHSSFLFSWSYGLLFHQGLVDMARSAILIPLGMSQHILPGLELFSGSVCVKSNINKSTNRQKERKFHALLSAIHWHFMPCCHSFIAIYLLFHFPSSFVSSLGSHFNWPS